MQEAEETFPSFSLDVVKAEPLKDEKGITMFVGTYASRSAGLCGLYIHAMLLFLNIAFSHASKLSILYNCP